ncbi:MAG: hypothetical protein M3O02_00495 [Acidobacteriota bacterium]|nr:hypothetical protein [Acidobacteriota bacterium]
MNRRRGAGREMLLAVALVIGAVRPVPLGAQGCTQCRDTTASTSPAAQRAFAHAIELMCGAAAALFVITLVVARRHP